MPQLLVDNGTYSIDAKRSQFTVQAFASGLISVVAHSPRIAIRDWNGEARFDPNSPSSARLSVKANTGTFDVLDEMRDDDRRRLALVMNQEVLEVQRYPELRFESTSIDAEKKNQELYRVNVSGHLTLHGVTNSQSFFSQVAFGVDSFRAYGEFRILQSDYGMKIASIAGGTLKLQDELKCSFYAIGRRESVS